MSSINYQASAQDVRTLTREDISYLRRADHIVAAYFGATGVDLDNPETGNVLGAIKRARFDDRFDSDKRVNVPINGNGEYGFFCYSPELEGILPLLRAGDAIYLDWYRDGWTTENHRSVGFHGDALFLDIRRGPTLELRHRFLIAVSVGPDNTARMCKRA